ncbi:MAG TPA: hypothetical protein VG899_03995 [Mycobacteriales bacterium]|nr:hypothetical protein [Mycobacteriales bacterium]
MRISAHGLAVDAPSGWDVQIFRRPAGAGEQTFPVLHAANFSLPGGRGDYGAGAVEAMGHRNVFVALVEHDEEAAHTPLFRRDGFPRPAPSDFSPRQLQRPLPGQCGAQYFFHLKRRAFCLYLVLGSNGRRRQLLQLVDSVLPSVRVA